MAQPQYANILVDTAEGGVGIVTLNRPTVLNALNFDLRCELDAAISAMENDPDIRAVVITGAGEKSFSAGADIHEMAKLTPEEAAGRKDRSTEFTWHLANLKVPTIGALNGLAYGGGALLSSLLDIRIGCERTKFRFLGAQYGRVNSTWTLPHIVGWARAKELLYTARVVESGEAAQLGLLNKVVPAEQLLAAAVEMGRQIAKNTPATVQAIKVLLNEDPGRSWRDMYFSEVDAMENKVKPSPVTVGFAEFLSRKGRK